MQKTDPNWCFQNPEEAARLIDTLTDLQVRNGQWIKMLEKSLADVRKFPLDLKRMWTAHEVKEWIKKRTTLQDI